MGVVKGGWLRPGGNVVVETAFRQAAAPVR